MVFDVEWLVVQWILSDRGKMEGDERMLCMVWSDAKIHQYYKGFWDKSQAADWPEGRSEVPSKSTIHFPSSRTLPWRRSLLCPQVAERRCRAA
jgi:hypothetical protein